MLSTNFPDSPRIYCFPFLLQHLDTQTCHISHCGTNSHRIWPIWKPISIRFFKSHRIFRPLEFEFLSIEQETRPKKAISNKEWNTAIFISGCQKCNVALQDVISAIFLGTNQASNTSIYTLSTYARHVIINPKIKSFFFRSILQHFLKTEVPLLDQ